MIRGEDGRPEYAWRQGGLPFNQTLSKALIEQGKLTDDESIFLLHDHDSGDALRAHGGSLAWNEYRQRWVMIASKHGARRCSEKYGMPRPKHLSVPGRTPSRSSRTTTTVSTIPSSIPTSIKMADDSSTLKERTPIHSPTIPTQTPRYDYNQIMYRLDLADERLGLDAQK